jgi:F-type H+-transporting ATPase subunit epsilon
VDAAEKGTDVNVERAKQAAERARERMAKGRSAEEIDYERAEVALNRAVARIKVGEKYH